MIDSDIPLYAALLRKQYIFQGLDDAQLAHVVARFERLEFPAGGVIVEEGSQGAGFYIIFQGRVQLSRQEHDRLIKMGVLNPGDYFGEETLLFDRARTATVTAVQPTIVLLLDRPNFYELLELMPDIRKNLSATAESRYLVRRETFDWIGDDEVIYLIARKHEFFLILSLVLPILLGIGSIPVFVMGFSGTTPFSTSAVVTLGILGILGSILWAVWNWLDWGNDYYIVTNQRVVWLERVIVLYYSRREAPMTQVLAVNIRSSFLGQILGYGNVEVRTYTGGILMRNCSDPKRFASFVENYQTRAKSEQKIGEAAGIDREIRQRLGMEAARQSGSSAASLKSAQKKIKLKVKPGSLQDKLQTFLQLRYERDGVITYRKHWLVLFRKTWKPVLVGLVLLGGYLYALYLDVIEAQPVIGTVTLTLLFLLFVFFDFLWWGYNYLDWSDDIYQLTHDQVLDIERKPLGDEVKKSAPLDSILSIEHERLGIIQLLFNYGNVIISVGQTQFIFLGVHNPDQVHQDVADYIEVRRRSKAESRASQERQLMGDWISSYHKNSRELENTESESEWDIFPG